MAAEGVFPKVDGDVLYSSEANLFKRNTTNIYSSTGFDSTLGPSAAAGSDEQSHELTAITGANLVGATYLKITILGGMSMQCTTGNASQAELKIQVKETGGAYGDSLAYVQLGRTPNTGNTESQIGTTQTIYYHTLTAGEIANGAQVKVFSKSTISNNGVSDWASFTNVQTIVTPI
jgi:hypothetical protein